VIAVNPSSVVLLVDLALLFAALAVVVLKMQNTRPDRASPTGRSNEVATSTIPMPYIKELTND